MIFSAATQALVISELETYFLQAHWCTPNEYKEMNISTHFFLEF